MSLFKHIILYRLKILVRQKDMIFWLLVFPMIMATLFRFTFANIGAASEFQPIDVAVVDADETVDDTAFLEVLSELSKGEDRLFNSQTADEAGAKALMEDGKIDGYILLGEQKQLIVSQSGIEQSIIKSFMDQYIQSFSAIERIASTNPESMPQVIEALQSHESFIYEIPISRAEPDMTLIYFYSLLAMASFFGGTLGMSEVNAIQANLSMQAARICVAPVHKLKLFLYNYMVACFVHFMILMALLSYLIFVLSIDFGDRVGFVILTIFIATIVGVSFGAFISSLIKGSENVKGAIIIGLTNLLAFLAGMMSAEIKHIVTYYVPILAYINPVNLITDAFYSLYFFDTYTRFIYNIIGLVVFAVIFCTATYFVIRRQKYASI